MADALSTAPRVRRRDPKGGVIVLGPFPPPVHGAAVITQALARRLEAAGPVRIVNTAPQGFLAGPVYHGVRLWRHLIGIAQLIRCAGPEQPVLYLSCPGGLGLLYLFPIVSLARLLRYRTVVHHHSFAYIDEESKAFRLFCHLAGPRVHHVCLCDRMADLLATRYPLPGPPVVCSNAGVILPGGSAVLDDEFRTQDRGGGHDFALGHLGNLSLGKGLVEALELFRALHEVDSRVSLHLAGPATSPSIEERIVSAQRQYPGKIVWHGPLHGSSKDRYYQSLDLFLMPTIYKNEAEPLVILEAAAAGVPTAAYARGCIAGVVGEGGLVVDTGSPFVEQVVPYALELMKDPERHRRARLAAIQSVANLSRDGSTGLSSLLGLLRSQPRETPSRQAAR